VVHLPFGATGATLDHISALNLPTGHGLVWFKFSMRAALPVDLSFGCRYRYIMLDPEARLPCELPVLLFSSF
jgi:hypothetical protein